MKTNMYQNNVKFIESNLPELNKQISEARHLTRDFEVEFTENNAILKRNGVICYANSEYDLDNEAEKILNNIRLDKNIAIIFGLGKGHVINYLVNNKNHFKSIERIILVEPIYEVFLKSLENYRLEDLFGSYANIDFIIGNQYFTSVSILYTILLKETGKQIGFAFSIPYRTIFSDYFEFIMTWLPSLLRLWRMNINTNDYFKVHWLNNALNNCFISAPSIRKIDKIFSGKPVLLVSAGPSLNDYLDFIKEEGHKFFIVAVGSAIGILSKNDIKADFYFAIDGSPEQSLIFDNISNEPILIFADTLYHEVVKNYEGRKMRMFIEGDLISLYLQQKSGYDIEYTKGLSSVAIYAMNALINWGFGRIYLIGQDLAYSKGELYSKGAWTKANYEYLKSKKVMVEVPDKNGNMVYTDHAFLRMLSVIEDVIDDHINEDVHFYNLGRTGLSIKSVEDTSIESFQMDIKKSMQNGEKERILCEVIALIDSWNNESKNDKIIQEMHLLKSEIETLISHSYEYMEKLDNNNLSETEIIKNMNVYSDAVDKHNVYKKVIEKSLLPAFYAIDETYKSDSLLKRQKLKVAESLRLYLAIYKILSDLSI